MSCQRHSTNSGNAGPTLGKSHDTTSDINKQKDSAAKKAGRRHRLGHFQYLSLNYLYCRLISIEHGHGRLKTSKKRS